MDDFIYIEFFNSTYLSISRNFTIFNYYLVFKNINFKSSENLHRL
jgi:hypothetical protein